MPRTAILRALALIAAFATSALVLLSSPTTVRAELREVDDPRFGPRTVTHDTRTSLEWLDLPLTVNWSFLDISQEFGPGGAFEGWRHATEGEVIGLWESAGIPDINVALATARAGDGGMPR